MKKTLAAAIAILALTHALAAAQSIVCTLSSDQAVYRGGDDLSVQLDFAFGRAATVDVYFSLSLGTASVYWDGSTTYAGPQPWARNISVLAGTAGSGVIFQLPQMPFGLPDTATQAGSYTWRFELRNSATQAPVAQCSKSFDFSCTGGVGNCGPAHLSWLPAGVEITSLAAQDSQSLGYFALQIILSNATAESKSVVLPAGLMFCSTARTQNVVIVKDIAVTLNPGETRPVSLPVYCMNLELDPPDGSYTVGSLAPPGLMDLIAFVAPRNVPADYDSDPHGVIDSVQEAIWNLTDPPPGFCSDPASIIQSLDVFFNTLP